MSIVLPMVKESQTSGGTGNLTGTAAVTNYFRGDTAPGGAIGRRYKYWIIDGANYEWGIGYKLDATTFVRETILGNSAGTTAAINFSASAEIVSMEVPLGLSSGTASWDGGTGVRLITNEYANYRVANVGITTAANYMWLFSARYDSVRPVTKMRVIVNTAAAAGGKAKIGLYDSDPLTGRPVGLPILETAEFLVDTTGDKSLPFTTGVPETKCLGRPLWAAVGVSDNSVQFEGYLPYAPGLSISPGYLNNSRPIGRYMDTTGGLAFPDLDTNTIAYRSGNCVHVVLEE